MEKIYFYFCLALEVIAYVLALLSPFIMIACVLLGLDKLFVLALNPAFVLIAWFFYERRKKS